MRKLALLVVSLFLLGCVLPLVSADDDSLKVVILLEDKQYSVGSPVKVTVHVFDKAKHVDADSVPIVVTGIYPTRAVSVSRTSTGVYEGTFTLQSSDLSSGYGMMSATATYGRSDDNDTTYNEAEGSAMISTGATVSVGLAVQCLVKSISTDVARPGTKVTVEAVVKHNGTAVVPSDFSIGLSYQERDGRSHQENMTTANPTVGTYECVYTVPELSFDTDAEGLQAALSAIVDPNNASLDLPHTRERSAVRLPRRGDHRHDRAGAVGPCAEP
jgi:5-hydroxyisourate hydrolase-like protein (transthyretin family)